MSAGDTRSVLLAAIQGDARARGALLERIRPRLVLWVSAHLSPSLRAHLDAEDVAQEILLSVHKGMDGFRGTEEREFFAWLFRMAENRIRDIADHYLAQKRQPAAPVSLSQTSPSSAAVRNEMALQVRRAIERLPEDYRRVLQLRRLEELEVPEVARRLGRSENAVRILYFRAIGALREEMRNEEGGNPSKRVS